MVEFGWYLVDILGALCLPVQGIIHSGDEKLLNR